MAADGGPSPVFLLSFDGAGGLADRIRGAGWRVVATRRGKGVAARFAASGAPIAIVDARHDEAAALTAIAGLAGRIVDRQAVLLALVGTGDLTAVDRCFDAGATHYLAPSDDAEVLATLRFLRRGVERIDQIDRTARQQAAALGAIIGETEPVGMLPGHDPLTHLDDIIVARSWIQSALAGDGPAPRVFVMLVSLSRFGMINAAFGRITGDSLLQGVARRLHRIVNDDGGHRRIVSRLPGAQFLLALAGETLEEATLLADRIVDALARPFLSQDHVISLSCRIGIADDAAGDKDSDSLLRRATVALNEVRDGDGSPVRVVQAMREFETELRSRLEIDLRHALDEDRIEILFQPQVAIGSGVIVGVEALARWRHPRLGELGAPTLFAAAERSDYLLELSAHVQRKALEIAAQWPPDLSALRLSINVTAADMVRPGFAAQFLEMVDQVGFARNRVTVELTESGLIEDLGIAADLLDQLRAAGLRAAIDDFGTGYSSLAYLKALPFDYLKIDKRFAQDIGGAARDRIVVRSVIDMARSLGLSVVAEGVETEEQLALLAAAGCNFYQGFLCAPPLDSRALHALVTESLRRPLVG